MYKTLGKRFADLQENEEKAVSAKISREYI